MTAQDAAAGADTGTTRLAVAVFAAGLAAVVWVAAGYVLASPLALAATVLIAVVYIAGALELRRFHRATGALRQALHTLQADPAPATADTLPAWLAQLPAALRPAVRGRIDGARTPLPGPQLAPYLVGLLVLLGMLGTFVGMVATLKGAAAALQTSSDLATIRSALMAPVQGLGLAFGTSVAGVAASAALGLVAALCRRARLRTGQVLDAVITTRLMPLSAAGRQAERQAQQDRLAQDQAERLAQRQAEQHAHQHAQTLAALQALAAEWRTAVQSLTTQQQALGAQLLGGQERFHQGAEATHAALAASVGVSLRDGLAESARLAGATITPAVDAAMAGIARETSTLHTRIADVVQQQLDGLAARFGHSMDGVAVHWQAAQQRLLADLATHDTQRLDALTAPLQAMARHLQQDWLQHGAQALAQQRSLADTLQAAVQAMHADAGAQTRATVAEVGRLLQAAGEAPRAAAEAMTTLRQQLSDSLARDQALQQERAQTAATLRSLLDAAGQATSAQRSAIDTLVATAGQHLQGAAGQVATASAQVVEASGRITAASDQMAAGAVELSGLGEAFGAAVGQFGDSNQALVGQLRQIEAALARSQQRSDEQLAYYVAQAREIIELSLLAQKQTVDALQQAAGRVAGEAL